MANPSGRFYVLSNLIHSTNVESVESLIPSFTKAPSTVEPLLRPVNGTRPRVFRTSTNGNSLLSDLGHELSCDISRQVISMYIDENYNHIEGTNNKQIEFLRDAGYYSSTDNPTKSPQALRLFLHRASNLPALSIKTPKGGLSSDQYKAYSESPFMSKALQYIEGEVNDNMLASERAKYLSLCCRLGWMDAGNSIQFPETAISTAQLAPPSNLKRHGSKLPEEDKVKKLILDIFQGGGFDGVKKGLKVSVFMSAILCRNYEGVKNYWPSVTGITYPGYDPDNELNGQRKELAQRLAVVLARDSFVKEGSGLVSEEVRDSESFKAKFAKASATQTSNRIEDEAAEDMVYDACFPDLAKQLGGTDADEMTPTKEGFGGCAAEEEAIALALVLFNNGDFIEGLANVSFRTFITRLLKTNWKRVKNLIEKNQGETKDIKNSPYEHTPTSDSSAVEKQQKALGDLVKQVIEFRKQEGYDDMVNMEKERGENITAFHDKKKAAKSTGLDSDASEDGEETKTSFKPSSKKKGKPKAVGKTAAGNGGSGNRGGSSKSSLDPFESNPSAKSVAKKKSSGSKSIGLKASSNKANTSSSRKGKKQPKGKKDRPSSSSNAHRGGGTKRQDTEDNGMSMDNVFDEPRRRSTSNYAHDDIGALLDADEADQRAADPGLHEMRVNDDVDDDSGEDAPDMGALSGDDDDEQQDIESSSDDSDDDYDENE